MELSIIIPVYNVESYLDECLKSVIELEINNYEVIIINDGSSDGSQCIINQYIKLYPDIVKCYVQEHLGPSVARNQGIALAQGEYVMFIDSDDYIIALELKKFWIETKEKKLDVGIANLERDYEGKIVADNVSIRKKKTLLKNGIVTGCKYMLMEYNYIKDDIKVEPVTKIYRRDFLVEKKLEFFPGIFYEDTLFFIQVMLEAENVCYFPYVFYRYRMRHGSITHSLSQKHYESEWIIACELDQMRDKTDKIQRIIDSIIVSLIYRAHKYIGIVSILDAKKILSKCKFLTPKSYIKKKILLNKWVKQC